MITIHRVDKYISDSTGDYIIGEFRGPSTDKQPKKIGEKKVGNGSVFITTDTGVVSIYDQDTEKWNDV